MRLDEAMMSLSDLKIHDCNCGCSIAWILQKIETRRWHIDCAACKWSTPECKTKRNAILAWNGWNRNPPDRKFKSDRLQKWPNESNDGLD